MESNFGPVHSIAVGTDSIFFISFRNYPRDPVFSLISRRCDAEAEFEPLRRIP